MWFIFLLCCASWVQHCVAVADFTLNVTSIDSLAEYEGCEDYHSDCQIWQSLGECETNPGFMYYHCARKCDIGCGAPENNNKYKRGQVNYRKNTLCEAMKHRLNKIKHKAKHKFITLLASDNFVDTLFGNMLNEFMVKTECDLNDEDVDCYGFSSTDVDDPIEFLKHYINDIMFTISAYYSLPDNYTQAVDILYETLGEKYVDIQPLFAVLPAYIENNDLAGFVLENWDPSCFPDPTNYEEISDIELRDCQFNDIGECSGSECELLENDYVRVCGNPQELETLNNEEMEIEVLSKIFIDVDTLCLFSSGGSIVHDAMCDYYDGTCTDDGLCVFPVQEDVNISTIEPNSTNVTWGFINFDDEYSENVAFIVAPEPATQNIVRRLLPDPTHSPSTDPTQSPTTDPTGSPTADHTRSPTTDPTHSPTTDPSRSPTTDPTHSPSTDPTQSPSTDPTQSPTTDPTGSPTADHTRSPTTDPTTDPSRSPTTDPTHSPTTDPTHSPTTDPTHSPTTDPTRSPTTDPTKYPTVSPVNTIQECSASTKDCEACYVNNIQSRRLLQNGGNAVAALKATRTIFGIGCTWSSDLAITDSKKPAPISYVLEFVKDFIKLGPNYQGFYEPRKKNGVVRSPTIIETEVYDDICKIVGKIIGTIDAEKRSDAPFVKGQLDKCLNVGIIACGTGGWIAMQVAQSLLDKRCTNIVPVGVEIPIKWMGLYDPVGIPNYPNNGDKVRDQVRTAIPKNVKKSSRIFSTDLVKTGKRGKVKVQRTVRGQSHERIVGTNTKKIQGYKTVYKEIRQKAQKTKALTTHGICGDPEDEGNAFRNEDRRLAIAIYGSDSDANMKKLKENDKVNSKAADDWMRSEARRLWKGPQRRQ